MELDRYFMDLEGVKRTPAGYNSYCPFPEHGAQNSRSFYVSLDKGMCKCFSCNRYMPLFDFLILRGAPVDVAIDYLFSYKHERKTAKEVEREFILGTKLPKSYIDRGLTVDTLKHFEVGYDEYEGRITTPLRLNGRMVGVAYREYPKRLYFTEGFDKDNFLYHYEPTKERTYVEGFTDTFTVWQNGTKEVSAILGSTASTNQIRLMSKHEVINLAYDTDIAGIRGMYETYLKLWQDVEINVVPYQSSKEKNDAGNCTQAEWVEGVRNKLPFVLWHNEVVNNPTIVKALVEVKQIRESFLF